MVNHDPGHAQRALETTGGFWFELRRMSVLRMWFLLSFLHLVAHLFAALLLGAACMNVDADPEAAESLLRIAWKTYVASGLPTSMWTSTRHLFMPIAYSLLNSVAVGLVSTWFLRALLRGPTDAERQHAHGT